MKENPVVKIAGVIAGTSVGVVAIIAIFAKQEMWTAAPIVGVLALMGIILAAISRSKHQP